MVRRSERMKTEIGVVIAITLSVLANIYDFTPEPMDTHVCIDEIVTQSEWCDHISGGSHTRCYKTESSSRNWRVCSTGWKAIDRSDIEFNYSTEQKGKQWRCSYNGCVPI